MLWILLGQTLIGSFIYSVGVKHEIDLITPTIFLPYMGLALVIVSLTVGYGSWPRRYSITMAATLAASLVYLTFPIYAHLNEQRVFGAMGFLVVWALAGVTAAGRGWRHTFDFITIVISLRFIVAYLEVFGGLAATGFGLILSGCVILVVGAIWAKYRCTVEKWLGTAL